MRNLKKILALVLAMMMVLSMMVTANAAFVDADEIDGDYYEAVEVLSAIGVIDGVKNADGTYNFNPQGTLTRAAAAKIVSYILEGSLTGIDTVADSITNPFSDLPSWAEPYVLYAYNEGVVVGDGNGKYSPTRELTGYEFGKMLLIAAGICDNDDFANSWKTVVATELKNNGLWTSKDFALSKNLTREEACYLAFNALVYGEEIEQTVTKYVVLPTSDRFNTAGAAVVKKEYSSYSAALAAALSVVVVESPEAKAVYSDDFLINTIVVTETTTEDSLAETVFGLNPTPVVEQVTDIDPDNTVGSKTYGKLVATAGSYKWVVSDYSLLGCYVGLYIQGTSTVKAAVEYSFSFDVYGMNYAEWKAYFPATSFLVNDDLTFEDVPSYVNGELADDDADFAAPNAATGETFTDTTTLIFAYSSAAKKYVAVAAVHTDYTMVEVDVSKDIDGNIIAAISDEVIYNSKINRLTGKITVDKDYSDIDWASYYNEIDLYSYGIFNLCNLDGRYYFDEIETVTGTLSVVGNGYVVLDGETYFKSNYADAEHDKIFNGTGIDFTGYQTALSCTLYLDAYGNYFANYLEDAISKWGDACYVVSVFSKTVEGKYGSADSDTYYYAQVIDLNGKELDPVLIGVGELGVETLANGLYKFTTSTVAAEAKLGIQTSRSAYYPLSYINNVYIVEGGDTIATGTDFDLTTKSITTVGGETVRLTKDTKYLFWNGTAAALKTKTVTGGIDFTTTEVSNVIATKDADGNYIASLIIIKGAYAGATVVSEDLVYFTGNDAATYSVPYTDANGKTQIAYVRNVYDAQTGEVVSVKSTNTTLAGGFWTYTVKDGIYTFVETVTDGVASGINYVSKYGTTLTASSVLTDADYSNAAIVDLRSDYEKAVTDVDTIDSISGMAYWTVRGYTVTFTALYKTVDGQQSIISIFVTGVTAP